MSDFWVCSDNIDGKENTRINAVCDALKKNSHTATNGGVGPNTVQSHGLGGSAKGQIGVFIVGGSDAGMYVDFRDGLKNGYYHYKYMWVIFASETATTDKWITCNGLSSTPLVRAWDDNYSGSSIESVGKSAKSYFDSNKQYINYACGQKGSTFDEVIQNFISKLGGSSDDGSSSSAKSGGSSENVKGCLQKLLKHWDGDVECVFRGKNVYINKIRNPEEHYTCALYEGLNVFTDNTSVTDINPNTPNHLIVEWTGGTIEFKDEKLIFRFGEKVRTLTAVRKVVTYVKDTSSDSSDGNDGSSGDGSSGDGGDGSADSGGSGDGSSSEGTRSIEGKNFNVDNYVSP